MTGERYQDLPAAKRRRLAFRAVLRGVLAAAVLVVLYYVLPLDRSWDADTAIRLLIGILVFAGVMVWQVRAIAGSRYPGLRAAGALGLIIPFYLVLFASTYFLMERASAANFTQPLTRTDALYFTVTSSRRWVSGTSPPNPRPPGSCSSSRCSPTSQFWAPACGCSWGRCNAAGNEDRIRAMTPGRPPRDRLPGRLAPRQPVRVCRRQVRSGGLLALGHA